MSKNPIHADYTALSEKTESSHRCPNFKVGDRVRIIKYIKKFTKGYTEYWSKGVLVIDSVWKTNPWTHMIKD